LAWVVLESVACVKFEHDESDVQVHLFVAHVAGKHLKACTRSYVN